MKKTLLSLSILLLLTACTTKAPSQSEEIARLNASVEALGKELKLKNNEINTLKPIAEASLLNDNYTITGRILGDVYTDYGIEREVQGDSQPLLVLIKQFQGPIHLVSITDALLKEALDLQGNEGMITMEVLDNDLKTITKFE